MSCSEWKEYKFKDIVKSRNQGVNTTTEKVEYVSNGYKVLRAKNISDYNIDYNDVVFIDEETFNRISSNCKPKTTS